MIAGQSATSVSQFVEDFGTRLRSMDRTYTHLNDTKWQGMDLRELFIEQLRQFQKGIKATDIVGGPAIMMSVQATKDAAMLIHEAVTNAAKHGCFSVPDGQLQLQWVLHADHILINWQESGLKSLTPPTHEGFGTQLFNMMPYLQIERDYRPSGLHLVASVNGTVVDGEFRMRV